MFSHCPTAASWLHCPTVCGGGSSIDPLSEAPPPPAPESGAGVALSSAIELSGVVDPDELPTGDPELLEVDDVASETPPSDPVLAYCHGVDAAHAAIIDAAIVPIPTHRTNESYISFLLALEVATPSNCADTNYRIRPKLLDLLRGQLPVELLWTNTALRIYEVRIARIDCLLAHHAAWRIRDRSAVVATATRSAARAAAAPGGTAGTEVTQVPALLHFWPLGQLQVVFPRNVTTPGGTLAVKALLVAARLVGIMALADPCERFPSVPMFPRVVPEVT